MIEAFILIVEIAVGCHKCVQTPKSNEQKYFYDMSVCGNHSFAGFQRGAGCKFTSVVEENGGTVNFFETIKIVRA